jgi:hypothetical protein
MFKAIEKKLKRWLFEVHEKYMESQYNLKTLAILPSGDAVYTYANQVIPEGRHYYSLNAMDDMLRSMSKERLEEYLDQIDKALNKGEYTTAGALVKSAQATMELYPNDELLFKLCSVFTVIDGEPEDQYLQSWEDKKRELFFENDKLRDFFLGWAFEKMENITIESAKELRQKIDSELPVRLMFERELEKAKKSSSGS